MERSVERKISSNIRSLPYEQKHWNTVVVEGLPKSLLLELLDHSYDLVFSKLTKKQKEEVLSL